MSSVFYQNENKQGIFLISHIYQHGTHIGDEHASGVSCPKITDLMFSTDNLYLAVYSHAHFLDGHYQLIGNGNSLDIVFTGHFSGLRGVPYLGYRVIEIYDDDTIGTYQYDPINSKIINSSQIFSIHERNDQ